jgi:hypothetical protein
VGVRRDAGDITDGEQAGHRVAVGAEHSAPRVDRHGVVLCNAQRCEAEIGTARPASARDQEPVGHHRVAALDGQPQAGAVRLGAGDRHTQPDVDPELAHRRGQPLADERRLVAQQRVPGLEQHHLDAERGVHLTQLAAHRSAA